MAGFQFAVQDVQHLSREERDKLLCEVLTVLDELRCNSGWDEELLPLGVPALMFKTMFNSLAKARKKPLPFRM